MIAYYLTHPQVSIEPHIPVPDWHLSPEGRARIKSVLEQVWLRGIGRIVSSAERKAIETATMIAERVGLMVEIRPEMGENDRSATGFLAPDAFEQAADAFFARPDVSFNGWETAQAAQNRIVAAASRAFNERKVDSPILLVGHGAVGTLLKCHVAGRPTSRAQDQPQGGGQIYAFDPEAPRLLCDWTALERFDGAQYG